MYVARCRMDRHFCGLRAILDSHLADLCVRVDGTVPDKERSTLHD